MTKGLLRSAGQLEVAQFWSDGSSDADAVVVKVNANSFEFSPDPMTKPFKLTKVFERAMVKGQHEKPAIRGGKITVRLQGIDAAELHFAPLLPGKG